MERDKEADRLEDEAQRLEEQSQRVDEHIRQAREDWERKEDDPAVPGAQPETDEDEGEDGS